MQAYFEEVALDEQGHVRLIRDILGPRSVPCPELDLAGGFTAFFNMAFGMNETFDPYLNDVNFLLSTWMLEEIGATGDKVGLRALVCNRSSSTLPFRH